MCTSYVSIRMGRVLQINSDMSVFGAVLEIAHVIIYINSVFFRPWTVNIKCTNMNLRHNKIVHYT